MTKADILKVLARVPMNAEIMFVEPRPYSPEPGEYDREHELRAAFTVTGPRTLCVLLTAGGIPTEYEDVERV